MKKFTKLLSLLLAVVMMLGLAACGSNGTTETAAPTAADVSAETKADTAAAPTAPNRAILGSTTELSGDFRYPGWGGSSAGASDQDIQKLTIGYGTMETNQGGAYVWNETAVKDHTETDNDDGTATYTVTINEGLTFSDGTPITAANYLAQVMAFSTPVAVAAGMPGTLGQSFVGYKEFNAYTGEETEGASKVFSGIRLLDEYTFSVTVTVEYASYYFAYTYAAFDPAPLGLWLGDGVEIKDDGEGCYLSDAFYAKDDAGEYVTAAHMSESRYDVSTYPFSGAYVITDWDQGTKQCTLTINPEFKGNFEGQTPSIETIVYVFVVSETQLEQLKTGAVDVLSAITGGDDTKAALAIVDDVNFSEVHYQRAGYGKVEFECDFGPTMFPEVRQAITYLLNRTEFCQTFTGGYGVVVDGPYSPTSTCGRLFRTTSS
ncbi:MAG: ABC transporter substrate-binding protein [Oscillospiraceae bacterium]